MVLRHQRFSLKRLAETHFRFRCYRTPKTDEGDFTTFFGRGIRGAEGNRAMIADLLVGSLGLFEYAYNKISDGMPVFLAEMEQILPEGE